AGPVVEVRHDLSFPPEAQAGAHDLHHPLAPGGRDGDDDLVDRVGAYETIEVAGRAENTTVRQRGAHLGRVVIEKPEKLVIRRSLHEHAPKMLPHPPEADDQDASARRRARLDGGPMP